MGVCHLRSLKEADLKGKKVLIRVDFNVPMDKNDEIIDDTKMRAALPTIDYILANGASLILLSHLGRPKGKPEAKYSLHKVAERLAEIIGPRVCMANDCLGPDTRKKVEELKAGEVLVLENVRFHSGEEKNDPEFSRQLASLGDLFVNDAFGSAHRAHSSTTGIAEYLPSYAGFLMEKEVEMLEKVLEHPESPRMAILGGAKVSDKLGLIENLLEKMDIILIGGGMANTFLKALGKGIGKSIFENELLEQARQLVEKAAQKNVRLMLPEDVAVAEEISADAAAINVSINEVPDNMMILDIGPITIAKFAAAIEKARTIIWNGPLGVYEYPSFARGTEEITKAIARSSAVSVIGGGDSAVVVYNLGLEKQITHISTGGGATLEFLEGIKLPGVNACEQSASSSVLPGSSIHQEVSL
ncbi:MAG: phosphoglycerate kinase [Syntrophomonadaceae bacterium]|nr:phosphoglycerate kinase [Syntrophomonadaceae bacterium]MDD3022807.1 phosphoglycerate kinase [Syntrophomonadaceae bacterium]